MTSESTPNDHPARALRLKLESFLVQGLDSSRPFMPKSSLDICWPEDLDELRDILGFRMWDYALLAILSRECRIIACILAWIKYTPFEETLEAICRELHEEQDTTGLMLVDSQLTLERDACVDLFGDQLGLLFYQTQFIFTPIMVSSTVDNVQEVLPDMRWPYASSSQDIEYGIYGDVSKVSIFKGYFQYKEKKYNNEHKLMVCKRIKIPHNWRKPVRELHLLKHNLSRYTQHSHITLHLAAFLQGLDFYLFIPYTPLGDLETFLSEGIYQSSWGTPELYNFEETFPLFGTLDLVREFANVVDATKHLHDRVFTVKCIPLYGFQPNLHPKNILVFPEDGSPVGVWRISDFGVSFGELNGGQNSPEPLSSICPPIYEILDGRWDPFRSEPVLDIIHSPYTAPERIIHDMFLSQRGDIWSLGCIFAEILVFSLGGEHKAGRKTKLEGFREERRDPNNAAPDGAFFSLETLEMLPNRQLKAIVKRHPKVDEWLRAISYSQDIVCSDLAGVLHRMLQPNPRDRCTAKRAHDWLNTTCEYHSDSKNTPRDSPSLKRTEPGAQRLRADSWEFLVSKRKGTDDSADGLTYAGKLHRLDSTGASTIRRSSIDSNSSSSNTSKPYSNPWRLAIKMKNKKEFLSSNTTVLAKSATSVAISFAHGVVVYLCRRRPTSKLHKYWLSRKDSRKDLYELRFMERGQGTSSFESSEPYHLPARIRWQELFSSGKHAVVVGFNHQLKKKVARMYDFKDKAMIDLLIDDELSQMTRFASSPAGVFAAYDTKQFALWHTGKGVFKQRLSPPLSIHGQIVFNSTGSFLFTWSCGRIHDTIQAWKISPHTPPRLWMTCQIPVTSPRTSYDHVLIPCETLATCIIRDGQGIWYTISTGRELDEYPHGQVVAVEQDPPDPQPPNKTSLCAANDINFFYVGSDRHLYAYDLVWDNTTVLHLEHRSTRVTETTIKDPESIALHKKDGEKYEFVICDLVGALETMEFKF